MIFDRSHDTVIKAMTIWGLGSDEVITCASSECHVTGGVAASSALLQLVSSCTCNLAGCSVVSDPFSMVTRGNGSLCLLPYMYVCSHTTPHNRKS